MALLLNNAQSEYLVFSGTPPAAAAPFTVSALVQDDESAGDKTIFSIGYNVNATNYWRLDAGLDQPSDVPLMVVRDNGGFTVTLSTGATTINTWYQLMMEILAANDRTVYKGGANSAQSVVSRSPASVNRTAIGALVLSTVSQYHSGLVAEIALWTIGALTALERSKLAKNYRPRYIRPQSQVAYWPLVNSPNDAYGNYNMTEMNTPAYSTHPRVRGDGGFFG